MRAPKPNALAWLGLSALVIALDQLSKAWVLRALPEYTDIVVIPGFWNWFRTYNTGAAFSFLANGGGWQIWFFSILAFAISGLLTWWLARTARGDWKVLPLIQATAPQVWRLVEGTSRNVVATAFTFGNFFTALSITA